MATGLPVSRLINVSVNLSPLAAQFANFNALLIVGDSDVIDVSERIRAYDDPASIAADFGTNAPEYAAALLFFAQTPKPTSVLIGRWAQSATAGLLKGGVLTAAEQALTNWTAITDGAFKVTVDGVLKSLTGLNFSAVTNLNGVASAIDTALVGGSCVWDGYKFVVKSDTTGATSTVSYATAGAVGHTDISALLKLDSGTLPRRSPASSPRPRPPVWPFSTTCRPPGTVSPSPAPTSWMPIIWRSPPISRPRRWPTFTA